MTCTNPAASIDIDDRKGIIAPGYDADLVVLDDNLDIIKVFIEGIEYERLPR